MRFAAPWAAGDSFRTASPTARMFSRLLPPLFPCHCFFPFSFSQRLRDPGRGCASRKSKVGITSVQQAEEHPRRRRFLLSPSNLSPEPPCIPWEPHCSDSITPGRSTGWLSPGGGGTSPASVFADAGSRKRRNREGEDKAPAGANGQDRAWSTPLCAGVPSESGRRPGGESS